MTLSKRIFSFLLIILSLLFVIPELLWSPLFTILFSFFKSNYIFRPTRFVNFSENIISLLLAFEFVGLLGFTILTWEKFVLIFKNHSLSLLSRLVLVCLSLLSLFVLWTSLAFRNIGF